MKRLLTQSHKSSQVARRSRPLAVRTFAAVVLTVTLLSITLAQGPKLSPREIAARILPATVLIIAQEGAKENITLGSGFFIAKDLVATNYHVVQGATRAAIKPYQSETLYPIISIAAKDEENDLAIVRITGYRGEPLALNAGQIAIGDEIYAAGSPRLLEGTFSQGIVSAIRPSDNQIQITAAISQGSSGGPVVDDHARVVAITVAIIESGQSLNFAIPVKFLIPLLAKANVARVVPSPTPERLRTGYNIAEIQGSKLRSPHEGKQVAVRGIVTARTQNGIFVQTPDDKVDNDPGTSEGIYVYLGRDNSFSGAVGDLVEATGLVEEYRPRSENYGLTITELTRANARTLSSKHALPSPVTLTPPDLLPNNVSSLERLEGMRVRAESMTTTSATGGSSPDERNKYKATTDGVFFATLTGVARPFREPGVEVFIWQGLNLPKTVPWFDTNPEMVRVDTDSQVGAKPLIVTAGATVKNVVGVLDYSYRRYTILADPAPLPTVEGNKSFVAVSPAGDREMTIGAFNLENFFDEEVNSSNVQKEAVAPKAFFQKRLNKASLAIRKGLSMPDVLGVQEVENLKALKKLAVKINADAVADGKPDPKYEAYIEEGNDPRGIDSGFLVKTTRVKLLESKQLAGSVELNYPGRSGDKLFDRPPFMVRVQAIDSQSSDPLTVTAIVNHFKSYGGIDDVKDGGRVQAKRAQEADWLAAFVADRSKSNPEERILLCGDFNAFVVNDGFNDLIGTLIGTPDQNVLVPGKTFATGLIDLAMLKSLPVGERYSYVFDGSAQVLDHVLINRKLGERLVKFGYARLNSDFPVLWAEDDTRPERLSDHDAPIAFFSLDPRKPAGPPAPTPTPAATPTP